MKLLSLVALGLTFGAAAVAQQTAMPAAPAQQGPPPNTVAATEQMYLQEATAHRDWLAKSMSLATEAQGLSKQVEELRAKAAEGDKKLAEANAEIAELKGRAPAAAPAAPAAAPASAPANMTPMPPGVVGSKGKARPGEFYNDNGTIRQVPPDEPKKP